MVDYFESYLRKIDFNIKLKKLGEKLNGKKIIIYGTGTFFQFIHHNYNLKKLNIIGISDMKYSTDQEGHIDLDYPIIPKQMIVKYNPDYILVATENYINIIEDFELKYLKDTKIKILPLAKKNLIDMIKRIWNP